MPPPRSFLTRPARIAACVVILGAALRLTAQEKDGEASTELRFASARESRAEYDRAVRPFFARHCSACHGEKKAEGNLDLSRLDPDMKESPSAGRWALLLEKLATREMPPEPQPRPADEALRAVTRWAQAELKRANKQAARRSTGPQGNALAHHLLFDSKQSATFDAPTRVRLLSPEIYAAAIDLNKNPGLGQPFSPVGGTLFKDMGTPRADEPVTAQLLSNALALVEKQTAHTVRDGKVVPSPGSVRELVALMDEKTELTKALLESATTVQFTRALSRKPTEKERERFIAFVEKNVKDAGRVKGVRYSLAAVYLMPEAIFRFELGDGKADEQGRVRLAPREIAFALAYALTDRKPEPALLAAADQGKLATREGVAAAVQQVLDDPRVPKPRILRFFREYFGYEAAREVFKENIKEFGYDAGVLISDTDALIEYVLAQDRDVLKQLLTTNTSFVNVRRGGKGGTLAAYHARNNRKTHLNYNLPADWQWTENQPIELPKEQRAGVLTQPAWLIAQSTSFDNHAIHRGKWVRERLLGGVVPDVPITVDAQLPDAPEKTLRQRMTVTQDAYCWKCHQWMNDVGLPFEMFDHLGRYRTKEMVLDAEASRRNVDRRGKPLGAVRREVPVDARGLIAHTGLPALEGPVRDAVEMLHRLAGSDHVEQVFVRHAFRYWMGRNETLGDGPTLQAAHAAYRRSGGSMKALITALLTSDSFLYRVPSTKK